MINKVEPKIELYNMDCMEYMKQCKDNEFDLAVVDPPYGIGADVKNSTDKRQSKKSASKSKKYGEQKWDADVPTKEYFIELFRVSKEQIIWGVNYYPFDFLSGGRIYWDKCVTMPTYSNGELAYCSLLNSIKSVQIAWHGMIQHDMKNKEVRIHPTQKPIKLYEWILKNYAKEGDRILDTHLGSGSSAIAAHNYKFDFVGLEIDKEYFDNAVKRFNNHKSQLTIF